MANLSQNLPDALFWRRFSAVGWTSIFAFVLHYMLLISRPKAGTRLNKYLIFVYIPAIINMYVFALSGELARAQYNLVKIDYGWTNIAVNNGWDYFYYLYYSLYMVLSLVIVWNWKKRIKDEMKVKQARLIFISILAAAVIGGLVDLAANTLLANPLPQMAPLFILLPVWAMYYPARQYGLVNYKKRPTKEIIVTEEDQKYIFEKLSWAFYAAAIFGFVAEYIPYMKEEDAFKYALLKGMTLAIMGLMVRIIQILKNQSLKDNLTILVLVSSIPIAQLQYLQYGSLTVWAFPMVIIIASIIFSKRTLLISTIVVAIMTQIFIWLLEPQVTVVIDQYDYILRVAMLITAGLTGLFINKMYVDKIKENDFKGRFQKLNARISSDFISVNQENIDEKVSRMLFEMGEFFGPDRISLFAINHQKNKITYSYEWCNEGIDSEIEAFESVSFEEFSWWTEQLDKHKLISIGNIGEMPNKARLDQEQIKKLKAKSVVSVPIEETNRMNAFMIISSVNSYRAWPNEDIKLLHILANLLSDALLKIKSEQEVEHMAYYDSLTKLPNRVLFKERVTKAINVAKQKDALISIIFIDLDNFKSVNDTIGHDGGDYLLKEVARSLEKRVKKTDTVARFGGDEFMIMLNHIEDQEDISQRVDSIMKVFSKPFEIYGQEFFVTGSGGISVFPVDGEDSESLIKNADTAMYEAKAKGKNQYEFCTSNMKEEVEKNMTLSNDLYYALGRGELFVYYQPQMDLNNKEITGLEALLRWEHPKLGMILPKVFIPIAEENGLINAIGEWVLKTACRQNKKWQDMGLAKVKIGVNLSVIQFSKPNLAKQVDTILKETQLPPKYLELEITESMIIKEMDFVVEALNKLKSTGISIAIDDFGTEYSSLSRLKKLPIDRIKIDMEFIQGIENNEKDKAITVIVINLAKKLGLSVIAEGVETAPQLEFLNQKMCDHVQGYYYYKPMPAEEMEKILTDISQVPGEG